MVDINFKNFSHILLFENVIHHEKGGFSVSLELKDLYDKIYKYCYFRVRNVHIAESLTQETFLKYFSQNSYINRGKPLAYLYTIARNLCIDEKKHKSMLPLEDAFAADNSFEALEKSLAMKQAISTLPKDLQEIILLRFSNDLKIGEIGRITGLSRYAVYRKINSGLKQLKTVLREEDFSE